MLTKTWTSKADLEGGTLTNLWVPSELNRLELKRLNLSGNGEWVFDGGVGKKFNWVSFGHTNPNQNIYYRDDFRDGSLEAWEEMRDIWEGINEQMKGVAEVSDWQGNRIRVGPITWEGQDILFKGYSNRAFRFFLRADRQESYNVISYGFVLYEAGNVCSFKVSNGDVLDHIDSGVSSPPSNTWYWFRIQIYTSGGNVIQRMKWWSPGDSEPGGWNVSHTWTGTWRSSGCFCFGLYTAGEEAYFDNILISRMEGIPDPPNCSVSFQFATSNDGSSWSGWESDISKVACSRYIKVKVSLSRTNLLSAMPTLEDFTLTYKLLSQPIFI